MVLPVVMPMLASTVFTGSIPGLSFNSPSSDVPHVAGPCRGERNKLSVAAAPEIATVVRHAATVVMRSRSWRTTPCMIEVSSVEPARLVRRGGTSRGERPDVWIPDSSIWVSKAQLSGVVARSSSSIASSPVLLAVSKEAAARVRPERGRSSLDRIMDSRAWSQPVTLGVPNPRRSTESLGALMGVQSAVSARSDARSALTWALRAGPARLPTTSTSVFRSLQEHPDTAFPSSEQQVWLRRREKHRVPVETLPLPTGGMQLDYPYVALGAQHSAAASAFFDFLRGDRGRAILAEVGFRDASGKAEGPLAKSPLVSNTVQVKAGVPSNDSVDRVIEMWTLSNEPSRLLTVLDVSGSMAAVVPGTGGATRLALTKEAAARGLDLFPEQSEIGLWTFSTNLTEHGDHRELVPIGPLNGRAGETSRRTRLLRALASTQPVPGGGTGLYDTTLAAVRAVRSGWDPTRVNSVLVLSDGRNDDEGISLSELLRRLDRERDPRRPVPVTAIAFGPDSDIDAMRQISRATGGSAYVAADPDAIADIFLDSVGQRLCRPFC